MLARTPQLWRGREPNRNQRTIGTGHARLDKRLPGGGWPLGALTELIAHTHGLGEFSLLFPALAGMSQRGEWLVLIDPPWIPYPATLQHHGLALERLLLVRTASAGESLWACEQALHGSRGGAVLAWPELVGYQAISFARLRRLQLAAETGGKAAFLFRPDSMRHTSSPAALRLHLQGSENRLQQPAGEQRPGSTRIEILKCRGQQNREPLWLPCRHPRAQPALRPASDWDTPESVGQAAVPGQHVARPGNAFIN
ncbi:MAG TPA: translesion DNA synthesis-associated protein ImuA [Xanthomonadales bacterium]|nr:translesion DNA synthesis-associated protein ImuA [Xanthomonadales bacterium]